ncbi:MAG: corrinoid protein [Candidatus Methanomethylophilaceae archaeon]
MSDFANETKAVIDAMVAYKVDGIQKAAASAKAAGMEATEIIEAMGAGMSEVGIQFQRGKLFLPHVLSAANGMTAAVKELEADLPIDQVGTTLAKVCMGTVEGDVHDIGKSIVSTMLQCGGFEVVDLGRDVPSPDFIDQVVNNGCTMVGLSALMTTTMTVQEDVIKLLKEAGVRDQVKVLVGGAPVTQAFADKIGADCFSESASEQVDKAKALLG